MRRMNRRRCGLNNMEIRIMGTDYLRQYLKKLKGG